MEFSELWEQIKAHEGQVFYTVRGKELRYTVQGNTIIPSRTRYQPPGPILKRPFNRCRCPAQDRSAAWSGGRPISMRFSRRSAGTDPQAPIQNAKNAEDIPLRFLVSAIPRHILPDSSS